MKPQLKSLSLHRSDCLSFELSDLVTGGKCLIFCSYSHLFKLEGAFHTVRDGVCVIMNVSGA